MTEKLELEAALSLATGDLKQGEKKVLRCQLEITQFRQEIKIYFVSINIINIFNNKQFTV